MFPPSIVKLYRPDWYLTHFAHKYLFDPNEHRHHQRHRHPSPETGSHNEWGSTRWHNIRGVFVTAIVHSLQYYKTP